jgi:ElaB/YqjD/DUF883 family membrane-anchored ribosome-binding protein
LQIPEDEMRQNGAALHAKDIQKEIGALKARLSDLADSLDLDEVEGIGKAISRIEARSKEAVGDAAKAAQALIDDVPKLAKAYGASIADNAKAIGESATGAVVETVKARPLGSIAAIIGIGFLAGYLCRRD